MGASPLIDTSKLPKGSSLEIAEEEFRSNILPISIRRRFPNGKVELLWITNVKSK
ncbi:DNA-directed RNA polymerase, subunit K [Metallosphaera cuprina Ar-4]|uniref:DNA-directed RNA polymerase, subunit K n=2 Tax=Sulfolobaceae TaxID=118883 RepID=F4G0P3_METCR|nr:DNA-directed RNA polymerase, subunit K [Metallosphaera cuprina Ar-4]